MIFYFSGVGNSRHVAATLAHLLHDELRFILDELRAPRAHALRPGEALGFVFPCYGWGVPAVVERFVGQLRAEGVGYVYFVTTCGDDTGQTAELFCRIVARRGWTCALGYAVRMPESYVCLPGFDVDAPAQERRKLDAARQRIDTVAEAVRLRRTRVFDTIPGPFKWVKSRVVRPFFNRFLITARLFRTNGKCTGCQLCARQCPLRNIRMAERRPVWGDDCALCLRCYHACPAHAVHWGFTTRRKGQYVHPDFR